MKRGKAKTRLGAAIVQRRFCSSHRAVAAALAACSQQRLVLPPTTTAGGVQMPTRLAGLGIPSASQRRSARLLRRLWALGLLEARPCLSERLSASAATVGLLDGLTLALDLCSDEDDRRALTMARGELDEALLRSSASPRCSE